MAIPKPVLAAEKHTGSLLHPCSGLCFPSVAWQLQKCHLLNFSDSKTKRFLPACGPCEFAARRRSCTHEGSANKKTQRQPRGCCSGIEVRPAPAHRVLGAEQPRGYVAQSPSPRAAPALPPSPFCSSKRCVGMGLPLIPPRSAASGFRGCFKSSTAFVRFVLELPPFCEAPGGQPPSPNPSGTRRRAAPVWHRRLGSSHSPCAWGSHKQSRNKDVPEASCSFSSSSSLQVQQLKLFALFRRRNPPGYGEWLLKSPESSV